MNNLAEMNPLDHFVFSVKSIYGGANYEGSLEHWKWIEEFQKSDDAWSVCLNALERNVCEEVSYYAALTLKNKIRYDLCRLSKEKHAVVLKFMVNHLKSFKPRMSVTREVCVGLASLSVQCTDWKNSFVDVLKTLYEARINDNGVDEDFSSGKAIIVFIEEFCNSLDRVGVTRKEQIDDMLAINHKIIFPLIDTYMTEFDNNSRYLRQVFKTFGELLSTLAFSMNLVNSTRAFSRIFEVVFLYEDSFFPVFLEAASAMCFLICNITNDEKCNRKDFYNFFIEMSEKLMPRLGRQFQNNNFDFFKGLSEVYKALMGEFIEEIVASALTTPPSDSHIFLEVHVKLCDFDDRRIHYEFFPFWIDIVQIITDDCAKSAASVLVVKYGTKFISQVFRQLPVKEEDLNETIYEAYDSDMGEFRHYCVEAMLNIFSIIDASPFYQAALECCLNQQNQMCFVEGSLYFIFGIISRVNSDKIAYTELLNFILGLSNQAPALVLETACCVLEHLLLVLVHRDPSKIWPSFNFLMLCLETKSVRDATSNSMLSFCEKAHEHLAPMFDQISSKINAILPKLKGNHVENLVRCCSVIIGKMDQNSSNVKFMELCRYYVDRLTALLNHHSHRQEELDNMIDALSCIFKSLEHCQILNRVSLIQLVSQVVSISIQILSNLGNSESLSERCCRLLRHSIKFIGNIYPHGDQIVFKVVELYMKYEHSCYLYLMCAFVEVFGDNPVTHEWLLSGANNVLQHTCYRLSGPTQTTNVNFLVEDMVRLCIRMFCLNSLLIIDSQIFDHLYTFIVRGLLLDSKKAFYACYSFMRDFFNKNIYNSDQKLVLTYQKVTIVYSNSVAMLMDILIENIFSKKPLTIVDHSGQLAVILFIFNASSRAVFVEATKRKATPFNNSLVEEFLKKFTDLSDTHHGGSVCRQFSIDLHGR